MQLWDVAISFVDANDLRKAKQLARLLEPQVSVFLYSNHSERTTGADGVDAFSEVFGREATLVVVLYRAAWGTTGWTGIEKTAINSRRVTAKTDDFLMVILMDDSAAPPWLPASRIYGSWAQLGAKGVQGAILARLRDLGNVPQPATAVTIARQMAAEQAWEATKGSVIAAAGDIVAKTNQAFKAIATATGRQFHASSRAVTLQDGANFVILARSHSPYGRDRMVLTLWRGEMWSADHPVGTVLVTQEYTADAEPPDVVGWRGSGDAFFTPGGLADHAAKTLFLHLQRQRN